MATNTVGLDIGRTAIRAVRLRRALTGRETVDFLCQEIPIADQRMGEARQAQLLKQFVHTHRLTGSRLMSAMPCSDLMIRTLTLPFHETKKLMQVIPSEVESMIPLPLEEVAVDYELLTKKKSDKRTAQVSASQVLVAAAQRSTLRHHVQRLVDAGLEPEAVRVDALALFSVVRRMSQRQAEPLKNVAIIDLGPMSTTVCLCYNGDPWMLRSIRHGTHLLYRHKQSADYGEALGESAGSAQKRPLIVEHMEPALGTLLRELRSTLHAYEGSTRQRLAYVWFSGDGAESSELTTLLARSLELEPITLPDLYRVPYPPAYAVAVGLALMGNSGDTFTSWRGESSGSAINLKKMMHTTLAQSQEWRRSLWQLGVAGLIIVLSAIVDLSVQVILKQSRLQELKAEVRGQFQKQFVGLEAVTDELDQAKAALQAIRKTTDLLGGQQAAMLPVLADLVRRFPKGTQVKIKGLTIERQAVQIEAESDSFDALEKIRQGLFGFPDAREVTVRDARVGSSSNQVLFRLTIARGNA
jgi:general secretion pathway protein L